MREYHPHGVAHPVGFSMVRPDGHENPSIGNSLACWDLGVVDEEDGFSTIDAVPYTLRQPSNVVGEGCGTGVFIRSAYELGVPLVFSCCGVKYSLEGNGSLHYGLHCMVGLCA